jgi:hypothetical protein
VATSVDAAARDVVDFMCYLLHVNFAPAPTECNV